MKEVKINSNLKLYNWQRDVINGVINTGKGYIHVVKAKRQVGKSVLIETLLLKTAIENNRTVSYALTTTLEQARKMFTELKNIIINTPIYRKHNDVRCILDLSNGSSIYFKSAEQGDALRGYTCTGIYCVDEAAYVSDEVFYKTLAWCNVSQCPIVICSTPNFKTGFFYEYYNLGFENGNKVLSYDWSEYDTSALLSNETLERYRLTIPDSQFKTDYLGEFLDNEGSVFGNYSDIVSNNFNEGLNTYMGIDWGTGTNNDETAICVFNSEKQMVALYHFNDKDETATINEIIRMIQLHKPLKVQVETNSIGQVFYGLLDKAIKSNKLPVMLLRFTTTNDSKERLINNFQVGIQNKSLTILNDRTLQVQMSVYEMKLSSTGKKTFNAHNGYHDDCIIAMLLAYDCINKGTYILR